MNGRTARHLRRLAERKHHQQDDYKPDHYVMTETKRQPNKMAKLNSERNDRINHLAQETGNLSAAAAMVPPIAPAAGVLRVVGPRATYQRLKRRYLSYRKGETLLP